nr:translation factor Sua5 [Pseudomonadota bacterium]
GLESTILYPRADGSVEVLRAGGISAEAIAEVIGVMPIMGGSSVLSPILSPGQLAVHYAPKTALAMGVISPRQDQLYLGFGDGELGASAVLNLSPSGDLTEAAHNLFDYLHRLDSQALALGKTIAVAPIPNHGLGVGINDRLRRASASC